LFTGKADTDLDLYDYTLSERIQKKTILLIDDDHNITLTFKRGLEKYGFMVDAFDDPQEAISCFTPNRYDLLMIDIRLPQITGFELYEKLRRIDDKPKICFITSFPVYYNTLKEIYPSVNANCFVQKPIVIEKLVELIRKELGLSDTV
jgi:two-component system, OmpR family, response regulator ChvI